MKKQLLESAMFLAGTSGDRTTAFDPALLVPQTAPELAYAAVSNPVTVPAGITMGASASVTFLETATCWC